MPYKNPKELLTAATALPAAIEAKLPEGVPKISATLLDITGRLPDLPDFPIELPDLPAVPVLPELPAPPGGGALRRFVTGVEVRPLTPTPAAMKAEIIPSPVTGVLPEVISRRGI